MKKLSILFIFATLCVSCLSAQTEEQNAEPTLEEIRAARKTMEMIELNLIRSGDDKHAASLILQDKQANEGAYLYLIEVPGYDQAVSDKTLLEFKKNVKSDDKIYRKLAKAASKTQIEKQEYIASIDPDYQAALKLYTEATH